MDAKTPIQKHLPIPVSRALRTTARELATWRKLRGLTQAQLADRANVSPGVVRRLEAADGGVSIENVLRILRGLGLLDALPAALDPLASDIGRLRADEELPRRVRPKRLISND